MRKFFLFMFVFVIVLSLGYAPVSAQTQPSADENTLSSQLGGINIPNTTNCFDDYTFGSVQTDISPSILSTVPGVPITFSGKIKNDNPYPIVDGSVYIKIFKKQKTHSNTDLNTKQNGPEVVDQFFAKEKVSIKAKGSEPILFVWQIPRNAESGDYQAVTYFASAKRFNLSGLSFTDDVTGNKADFSIKSDVTNPPVFFNKNTVTLNQKPHKFAIFPLHFNKDEDVTAEAELVNPSKQDKTIQLTWKLYRWDGLREENKKDEKSETITLKANETKKVSYTVGKDANTGSVAYLVAGAKDKEAKSILNIRFVRDGIEETRLNFPSITSYPLTQGQENSLFSCVHSTNFPIVKDNTLTLTLKTLDGKVIHQYTYQGDISGEMMGVKEAFTPNTTIQDFTLTATLKRNNQTVEEVTQTYLCDKLGENCKKASTQIVPDSFDFGEKEMWTKLALFLVGAILLFFIIRRMVMKRSNSAFSFLLALLIASSLFIGVNVKPVEASSITWPSGQLDGLLAYVFTYQFASGSDIDEVGPEGHWNKWGFSNPNISISYSASAEDISGNNLPDGTNVLVGSTVKFHFTPHDDTDISWFGTGYNADSPYGKWLANANAPSPALPGRIAGGYWGGGYREKHICGPGSPVFIDPQGNHMQNYITLSVNPPNKSFAGSPNLNCGTGIIDANGYVTCSVTGTGQINTSMVFKATYAKFYYRQYDPTTSDHPSWGVPGCFGSNIPMSLAPLVISGSSTNGDSLQTIPYNPLTVSIPAQTINFSFNAVSVNGAPTKPTLTGDTSGAPYQLLNFTASDSTDPEGSDIRYIFDFHWDGDDIDSNNPFPFAPPSPYIAGNSGVYPSYSTTYSWSLGTYRVRVKAEDTTVGNDSPWSDPLTVTISIGACGSAVGTPSTTKPSANLCSSGTASVVSGGNSNPWTWTCLGPDNTTTTDDVPCSALFQDLNNCEGSYIDDPCDCNTEEKTRHFSRTPPNGTLSCIAPSSISVDCTASEKNSCRDFNYREVAP